VPVTESGGEQHSRASAVRVDSRYDGGHVGVEHMSRRANRARQGVQLRLQSANDCRDVGEGARSRTARRTPDVEHEPHVLDGRFAARLWTAARLMYPHGGVFHRRRELEEHPAIE
jgi:hypothetical protein